MAADVFAFSIPIPYSEYWLPLVIGLIVGVVAITAGKLVGKNEPSVKPSAGPVSPDAREKHDPFVQGSNAEQRKAHRRFGNPVEVHFAFPGQKERPRNGWVVDRSLGGLCVMATQEVKVGVTLSVLPASAPSMTPWMDVEVRSCRQTPDGYEVGCQWIKTPAWSILLMFG